MKTPAVCAMLAVAAGRTLAERVAGQGRVGVSGN